MSDNATFQILIRGDLLRRLPEIKDGVSLVQKLAKAMDAQNIFTVSHIQQDYLTFPGTEPTTMDGLRYITGSYQRSLRAAETTFTDSALVSGIGSNVVSKDGISYPAVHEFGADIPAHDIRAKNARALRFVDESGKVIFRKVVHFPGAQIKARKPIQRGIQDRANDYTKAFETIIVQFLKN